MDEIELLRDAAERRRVADEAVRAAEAVVRAATMRAADLRAEHGRAVVGLAAAARSAHQHGWSTRELAREVDLSHQRVHQLVTSAART